jgi:hypothetical protein
MAIGGTHGHEDPHRLARVARTRVDVPMFVLRGEWLKAIGFPIGAKAFLSTDKHGDIQLTRMGLKRPKRLRIVKASR